MDIKVASVFWFLKMRCCEHWSVCIFELEFSSEICPGVRLQDCVIHSFYFSGVLVIAWGILSLSDNSNISVISVLACNDCLFSHSSWGFSSSNGVTSNWNLDTGYYAVRIWILLKTYILAGFFWDCPATKGGRGGGHSTSTARQRWKFRIPLGLCEHLRRGAPFAAGLAVSSSTTSLLWCCPVGGGDMHSSCQAVGEV